MDATTGARALVALSTAPDYGTRADTGTDNTYNVTDRRLRRPDRARP